MSWRDEQAGERSGGLRIGVTGATGVIGRALMAFLKSHGHHVQRLVRRPSAGGTEDVFWDPARGEIDARALEGFDAFVHLAGANVGEGRWTEARKAEILGSRRDGTRLLARTLAGLERRPRVLVSASGVGVYGDRGDEVLDEDSAPGRGFLAEVCKVWEAETEAAAQAGIRVVRTRMGVVLAPEGGALARMVTPVKLGVGGRLGSGRQYMSWVALDDVLGAMLFALTRETLSGPVNVVAPNPVTNAAFVRTLAGLLHRPAILPVPAAALKLAVGPEMAEELVLASQRVVPRRLEAAGFRFAHPHLEVALARALGMHAPEPGSAWA